MADYIYLLQNRLSPAQRAALEAVRDAARAHGMPVFLVGGAVRDLTSGAPVRDLDFAVQGDVSPLSKDLQAGGASIAGENPVLGSTFLLFRGGVRVEVGPTLTVSYPKPAQPETQPATILDDLRRRDFTVNAMAISLNEGSYGLLLDPLNGVADAENRELRLVSNYGFIEQPALLLRAARLTERMGWTLEERTQNRYETAKEEGYVSALPAWDRGYELEGVFHEEDPVGAWEHLQSEGWANVLFTPLQAESADAEGIERVRDIAGQMEQIGIHTDASPVLFPLIVAKLSGADLESLKSSFVRHGFRQQVDSLEARGKELAGQMTSKAAAAPSETWKLLFAAEPEVVLWTATNARTPAVQSKLKNFLTEWPQMRQRIPYALMQEMRITPELPQYEQLLEDLFFALMDGKLATTEAMRAFLEPFSPPAPVVQAAPRRKAAKSARGRGRKAQEPAASAVEADETSEDRDEEDEDRPRRTRETDEEDEDDEDAASSGENKTKEDRADEDHDSKAKPPVRLVKNTDVSPKPEKAPHAPAPAAPRASLLDQEPEKKVPTKKAESSTAVQAPRKPVFAKVTAKAATPVRAEKPTGIKKAAQPAAKQAAPGKVVAKKAVAVPVKIAAKATTKKVSTAPEKVAATVGKKGSAASVKAIAPPSKKASTKSVSPAAKTVARPHTVVKASSAKAVAKKAAAKVTSAPAKKIVAKKTVAKARKRYSR